MSWGERSGFSLNSGKRDFIIQFIGIEIFGLIGNNRL
jgi:hypothetical protein